MHRVLSLVVFRTLTLLAMAASAALLFDYTRPVPAFCESGTGCDAVRSSAYAYVLGIPQPVFGLFAFLVLFGLTFVPHERRRKLLLAFSLAAAVAGAVFLALQALVVRAFCPLCVVVDASAMLLALVAITHYRAPEQGHDGAVPRVGWTALCALVIALPLLFGAARPDPPVPPALAALWVPGKLNIVELSDFECPFCRMLHPSLKQALEPYGDRVHFVRVSMPLKSHPNAEAATKAYLCARNRGLGEPMAHELFVARNLDVARMRELALVVGLQGDQFDRCFQGEEAEQALRKEVERARAITFKGLPTVWIGKRSLLGAQSVEHLRAAIDQELAGEGASFAPLRQEWLWTVLGVVLLGVGAFAVLRKPHDEAR